MLCALSGVKSSITAVDLFAFRFASSAAAASFDLALSPLSRTPSVDDPDPRDRANPSANSASPRTLRARAPVLARCSPNPIPALVDRTASEMSPSPRPR